MIFKVVLTVKCNKFGKKGSLKHISISIVKFILKTIERSLLYGEHLFLFTSICSWFGQLYHVALKMISTRKSNKTKYTKSNR